MQATIKKKEHTSSVNLELLIRAHDPSRVSSPLVSQFGGSMPQITKPISGPEKNVKFARQNLYSANQN